jgi:hypothetical protein
MRVSQGLNLRSDRNNLSAELTWSKDTQQETSQATHSLTHSHTGPPWAWGKTALQQWLVFPRFGGSLGPFHMSVWIRLACWSGGLSLQHRHLDDVVKSPWVRFYQVFYMISGTSSMCSHINDWFGWCQVISGTNSTCGRIHDWIPNCCQGFSLLFFWSVGDLLFVFPHLCNMGQGY